MVRPLNSSERASFVLQAILGELVESFEDEKVEPIPIPEGKRLLLDYTPWPANVVMANREAGRYFRVPKLSESASFHEPNSVLPVMSPGPEIIDVELRKCYYSGIGYVRHAWEPETSTYITTGVLPACTI